MDKIKKICKSVYLPFIVFAIILICTHIRLQKVADDIWFADILKNQGILEYTINRYNTWTSRTIIESILVSLANTNVSFIIWKVLNILMFELLAYSTYKLFIKDIKEEKTKLQLLWILIFGILLIPFSMLKDAGWIATTTNYLWVLALGMFLITIIKKSLKKEKIKWYYTLFYILAALYASNQEQMAATLFAVFTLYILYLLKTKQIKTKLNKTTIFVYIVIILNLIYILTCPGNLIRKIEETQTWYGAYQDYGIVSKLELGITSMMKYLIIDGRVVFIVLTAIMAYYVTKKYKNTLCKIIGIIPFIGSTFLNVFSGFTNQILPKLTELMNIYSKNELIINITNKTQLSLYIPITIYGIILLCILINIYLIFKNTNKCKIIIIIYMLGLATRLIMGFSPTVFASAERTSLFLYFSFIIIIILTFKQLINEEKNITNIQAIYIIIAILNLIDSIVI